MNVEKLKNIGKQLINDLLRIGQLHYNIDNNHSQQFTDTEREQLKNDRLRELIAVSRSILAEILDDPKNFLEIVQKIGKVNDVNESNGVLKETQPTKRATKQPSAMQSKRSPNVFAKSSNHEQIVNGLVKTIQDQLDKVHIDKQYHFHEESDAESDVFLDYGDYDYNDSIDGFGSVGGFSSTVDDNIILQRGHNGDSHVCHECEGNNRNPPLFDEDASEHSNRNVEQVRSYQLLLAKLRQHPLNRFRGSGDAYRYGRYRNNVYCPPCVALRRTPNRRPFSHEVFNDDGEDDACTKCVANSFRSSRNFNRTPNRPTNDWWNAKNAGPARLFNNSNNNNKNSNQRVTNGNQRTDSDPKVFFDAIQRNGNGKKQHTQHQP